MSAAHLRPLSFAEILDGSSTLLRRHFAVMFATALAAVVPLWLLGVVWQRFVPQPSSLGMATGIMIAWQGVELVFLLFAWAALAHQVSRAYLGEEEVTLEDGLSAGTGAMGRLLGVVLVLLPSLVATLLVFFTASYLLSRAVGDMGTTLISTALVVLAAGWWVPRLFAVVPAVVVEGQRPLAALERSERLGAGERWRILAMSAVAWVVLSLPGLADWLVLWAWQQGLVPSQGPLAAAVVVLQQAVFLVGRAAALPLAVGFIVLLYYDRRVRAEALDLEVPAGAAAPA